VIELYAISDDAGPPAPPLRALSCDGLTAFVGPAEFAEVTPDVLWRHEEVVESLMEQRDLLPVRFGTVMSDEGAAMRAVGERREQLEAALARVRGAVELAVRVVRVDGEDDPRPRGVSGHAYMRAKAGEQAAAQALNEPLSALARESLVHSGPELLRAAYLLDRGAVERFVGVVRRLQSAHPELRILCTGPWPPYSFVETGASR
jgi:Gas vesicle synthesis protein GvpL/GvpF